MLGLKSCYWFIQARVAREHKLPQLAAVDVNRCKLESYDNTEFAANRGNIFRRYAIHTRYNTRVSTRIKVVTWGAAALVPCVVNA